MKDGRLFIRYRYYSIFALFHVDCAGSTPLMATTSVNCMMDLGQIHTKTTTLGGARGTTTIAKERRRFNRYRYYSILGLFHVECAGSTALMATTSVNCMMDSGQIPTTANTT